MRESIIIIGELLAIKGFVFKRIMVRVTSLIKFRGSDLSLAKK